jgi:hypothetical protein
MDSQCLCEISVHPRGFTGKGLKPTPYRDLDLKRPWESFDLAHELTTRGIQKFVADYQSTLRRSA